MKIAVINTGGTISCVGNPLAPMSAAAFAQGCEALLDPILGQAFPQLAVTYVTDLVFPESKTGTLDSTNLQPTDWCLIAGYILAHYAAYDGWVVLHGTDSMDFTGAALPFLLQTFDANGVATGVLSKPVIITGSQVPLFYQASAKAPLSLNFNTDAYQNFCGAVAAAQSGIPEVAVCFQNKLYRGSRVLKTNASQFYAFSSPNYPALAEYGVGFTVDVSALRPGPVGDGVSLDDAAVRQNAQQQLAYVAGAIDGVPVMQFGAFPAWYDAAKGTAMIATLVKACVGAGIRGLVLESYGEGNFPSGNPDEPSAGAIYRALAAANAEGVVLVDCTQVIAGVVNDSAYAAGAWLPAVGALDPADMTPMAALAKLMILLAAAGYPGNQWSAAEVKRLVQLDLAGEMLDTSRLDSRTNRALVSGQSIGALDGSATLVNDPVRGPLLTGGDGKVLWQPLAAPAAADLPGRLVMQDDGNLVYYSRGNRPMWATNTGQSAGASSMLIVGGSYGAGDLVLEVYDYAGGAVTATLYRQ